MRQKRKLKYADCLMPLGAGDDTLLPIGEMCDERTPRITGRAPTFRTEKPRRADEAIAGVRSQTSKNSIYPIKSGSACSEDSACSVDSARSVRSGAWCTLLAVGVNQAAPRQQQDRLKGSKVSTFRTAKPGAMAETFQPWGAGPVRAPP